MTVLGTYEHYKGGRYHALFVARNSNNGPDDGRPVVVYISATTGEIFARDEEEFHGLAKSPTHTMVRRFRKV